MTEPHQTEHKAGQEGSGHDQEPTETLGQPDAGVQHETPAAETKDAEAQQAPADTADAASTEAPDAPVEHAPGEPAEAVGSTEPAGTETATAEAAGTEPATADGEVAGQQKSGNTGLLLGIGGGIVVLIVVLVVGAFVWPGFLAGPGKPDDKAAAAVVALSGKNAAELDKVSCHGPDGKVTTQIPPEALQLITAAKPAGPTQLSIDTEALAPVDLTISSNGQSKTAPVDLVLGVNHGEWCMKRISQRQ